MGKKEHQPKPSRREQCNRIDLICICLKNGLSHQEIEVKLNQSDKHYSHLRGECSASSVKRVINQLPLKKYQIENIIEIEQYSRKDRIEKHDLEVVCSDEDIGVIGVQVKSSIIGIEKFYKQFHQDYNLAKEIVMKNKIIVINRSLEDSIIQRNFCEQFKTIREHCKMLKYLHG